MGSDRPDEWLPMYENPMVRLQCTKDGRYFVEAPEFSGEMNQDEAEYLTMVMSSAIHHGLPTAANSGIVGEYLFQCCLAVCARDSEVWDLFFKTVPALEMGRMLADDWKQSEGNVN